MTSTYKELYGLIGLRLGHSFSQDFFNRKFEAENIDARYVNFEIDNIDAFKSVVSDHPNLKGLNVTIPYKQQVMHLLDEIDPKAAEIGAVNVIKIIKEGRKTTLKGYNSDFVGFRDSIEPMLGDNHRRALILGTGGASRAIDFALRELGISTTFVSRSSRPGILGYDELTPEVMASNTIIVNTTPLGMYPGTECCPEIPYDLLTPEHICYDLIYNPDITMFMRQSSRYGAVVKNGLEMLLLQAFESWQIWHS